MNKLAKVFAGTGTALLTLSLLVTSVSADDLTIGENGNNSNNKILVNTKCTTKLTQNSNASVGVGITAVSNTGGNTANSNVGSGVSIGTGAAATSIGVLVSGGSNTATTPDCCCEDQENNALSIVGNGNSTTNKIDVKSKTKLDIKQKSKVSVGLSALFKSLTGKNKANNNVGGTVDLTTDESETNVGVEVVGGENVLN